MCTATALIFATSWLRGSNTLERSNRKNIFSTTKFPWGYQSHVPFLTFLFLGKKWYSQTQWRGFLPESRTFVFLYMFCEVQEISTQLKVNSPIIRNPYSFPDICISTHNHMKETRYLVTIRLRLRLHPTKGVWELNDGCDEVKKGPRGSGKERW